MSEAQLRIIDNAIEMTNSRIVEQTRIIDKSLNQRDALLFFKKELEDLRDRLVETSA